MPKYTDGKRIINATEKAYEILYKARGFKPYDEEDKPKFDKYTADNGVTVAVNSAESALIGLKKDELLEMAQDMQLDVSDKMTKTEIVAAIEAADAE